MRRTQPQCLTIILTGYPGFETALQAIRSQVDDYLIKPAPILTLVTLIEQKLSNRQRSQLSALKRIPDILREKTFDIAQRALTELKSHPLLGKLPLSDQERIAYIPELLRELAEMLESNEPDRIPAKSLRAAEERGEYRYQKGYTVPLLATQVRLVNGAMYEVIRENLLSLNLSYLMFDLKRLNDCSGIHLEHSLKAYLSRERSAPWQPKPAKAKDSRV
jgi:YesN/AraC family two-component response regulator